MDDRSLGFVKVFFKYVEDKCKLAQENIYKCRERNTEKNIKIFQDEFNRPNFFRKRRKYLTREQTIEKLDYYIKNGTLLEHLHYKYKSTIGYETLDDIKDLLLICKYKDCIEEPIEIDSRIWSSILSWSEWKSKSSDNELKNNG